MGTLWKQSKASVWGLGQGKELEQGEGNTDALAGLGERKGLAAAPQARSLPEGGLGHMSPKPGFLVVFNGMPGCAQGAHIAAGSAGRSSLQGAPRQQARVTAPCARQSRQ